MRKKLNFDFSIGLIIVGFYLLWMFLWSINSFFIKGSLFNPYWPKGTLEQELLKPFTDGLILGTDLYGRSLFETLSAGVFYSIGIAFLVSICCAVIGSIVGYLSVRAHRGIGIIADYTTNLVFIFPGLLIAIIVMSVTGSSIGGLILALVITGWSPYSRIVRGECKRILGLSYVEASEALGISEIRLFFKIIVPAIIPQLMVHIVLGISGVIISESALGFLGLGGSEYSWGSLLSQAKDVLLEAPHLTVILSFFMGVLIIGLNLLGDGLRDYLDPYSR